MVWLIACSTLGEVGAKFRMTKFINEFSELVHEDKKMNLIFVLENSLDGGVPAFLLVKVW